MPRRSLAAETNTQNESKGDSDMKSTTLKRDGRVFASWIGGAALLAVAPLAWAVPPAFTGTPITAPIPAIGQNVVINLRQQGVISGSASISAGTGQQVVFINGQPSGLLSIEPLSGAPI